MAIGFFQLVAIQATRGDFSIDLAQCVSRCFRDRVGGIGQGSPDGLYQQGQADLSK